MRTIICSFLIGSAVVCLTACGSGHAAGNVKHVISTADAPAPVGPYNQGILFGETLSCAGQIGIDPLTGSLVEGGAAAEAEQALKNLGAVLRAAGMDYQDAVMATVFLTNIDDYTAVNEVYANYFSTEPPARQVVEIGALPRNASVEISLVAMKSSN